MLPSVPPFEITPQWSPPKPKESATKVDARAFELVGVEHVPLRFVGVADVDEGEVAQPRIDEPLVEAREARFLVERIAKLLELARAQVCGKRIEFLHCFGIRFFESFHGHIAPIFRGGAGESSNNGRRREARKLFCVSGGILKHSRRMRTLFTAVMLAVAAAQAFGVSAEKIADAERVMWSRFFVPKTKLFYECLSSFDEKTCQSHLPTAEEVGRQYPNPCGYATGMEDCAILGGTVLAALADKYEMSPDPQTAARAKLVAEGLESLVLPDGFVARGLCVEDGRSVYINSSVDSTRTAFTDFGNTAKARCPTPRGASGRKTR